MLGQEVGASWISGTSVLMGQKEKGHIKSHRRESYRVTFPACTKMKGYSRLLLLQ